MGKHETVRPPGERIKVLLAERNLTQGDLATITGLSRQSVNSIISGRTSITAETAVALANTFGNEASEWLQLDNEFRLSLIQDETLSDKVQQKAKFFQLAPVAEMVKRGWITTTDDFEVLANELKRFFETDHLESLSSFEAACKKTGDYSAVSEDKFVRAWLFQARKLARNIMVARYDEARLTEAMSELRRIAAFAKETHRVPQVLAKFGIRFVIVEQLPHTKIDGAAFWLDENSPVIAMSIRYDRIDSFWFTLMHEFAHIKHKDLFSLDEGMEESKSIEVIDEIDYIETRANMDAAASLIDPIEIESFVRRIAPLYSEQKIIQFAHRLKIHPGIIVGQLQRRKEIGYSSLRGLLVKVRDSAIETAITDGWGKLSLVEM
jgi:HTH-type transcriptional regulator / antitoxin HigA